MTCGAFSSPVSLIGKQDKAAAGKFRDKVCESSKAHQPFGLSGNSAVFHSDLFPVREKFSSARRVRT